MFAYKPLDIERCHSYYVVMRGYCFLIVWVVFLLIGCSGDLTGVEEGNSNLSNITMSKDESADYDRMCQALTDNNLVGFEELVKKVKNPNIPSKLLQGFAPLWYAVACQKYALIPILLTHPKIDVNVTNNQGRTTVQRAIDLNDPMVVNTLIGHKSFKPNFKDHEGKTALLYAAVANHEALVKALANVKGTNLNAKDKEGFNALWQLCQKSNLVGLTALLEADTSNTLDLNAFPPHLKGQTPLHRALDGGFDSGVALLLKRPGLDVKLPADTIKLSPLEICLKGKGNPSELPKDNFKGYDFNKLTKDYKTYQSIVLNKKTSLVNQLKNSCPEAKHWYIVPNGSFDALRKAGVKFYGLEKRVPDSYLTRLYKESSISSQFSQLSIQSF